MIKPHKKPISNLLIPCILLVIGTFDLKKKRKITKIIVNKQKTFRFF